MLVSWLDKTSITTNDMTQEGLENLKAVLRKAIELQVNATLVMATLQSIYCDEEDELDRNAEKSLLSAIDLAKWSMHHTVSITKEIQKAYGIEKGLAKLEDILDKEQDDDDRRDNNTSPRVER